MATIAQATTVSNPIPTKKARSRKALKPKDSSNEVEEANSLAGSIPESLPVMPMPEDSVEKENQERLSKNKPKKGTKKGLKAKQSHDDSSTDEANILAGTIPESSPVMPSPEDSAEKENHESPSKNKAKKGTKKGVKAKQSHDDSSTDEANILAGTIPESSPVMLLPEDSVENENHESPSKNKAKKGTKKGVKAKQSHDDTMEKELLALQEKLQKMTIEKEQTEEMLKEKDLELKKLQKAKEFKPILTIPSLQSMKEQEKKKKGNHSVKKPSPAYVLWCKDQWTEVKKSKPEADFKEVSTLLGAKWKTISAEEKKPYEEKYQAEKDAYLKIVGNEKREHEAMKLFEDEQKQKTAMELLEQYTQFVLETEKATKKSKKVKDESKPKHPMSAFIVFSNERRASSECNTVKEFAKIAGEEWRNMTEAQKAPYEEIAMKNKEQYVEEMKVYKQKKEEEEASLKKEEDELMKLHKQEAMQLLKKKEMTDILIKKTKENTKKAKKEKKNDDPNKPKRPASSFILFSKEERKNLCDRPEINNSTVNALISVKWKELSEEEKQKWNAKAAVAMEAYKKELEEYNKSAAAGAESSSEGSN